MFDDEFTAFDVYCKLYPDNPTLLVDTYNVLSSGVPNAIKPLKARYHQMRGAFDSGDITYLSRKTRKCSTTRGCTNSKIIASNSLDEYVIRDVLAQARASTLSAWASGL